ncbi:nudix hydrolase 19, chloroplastic-like isoform X2 [Curcuma longa]|uniref:nudix hydrolase 19, chloroplastic-like isoform X2 n=1 Tax=Curcuma longa TaxID=136217 RepID=UPI003D9E33B6
MLLNLIPGRRRPSLTALTLVLEAFAPPRPRYLAAMAINLEFHTFAGNPLRSSNSDSTSSPRSSLEALKSFLSGGDAESSAVARVLPFRKGRAWVRSTDSTSDPAPKWSIGWVSPAKVSGIPVESFVYLGSDPEEEASTVSWAVDVSNAENLHLGLPGDGFGFVDLRTLMVATNWADSDAMGALAIAGHAGALLEWHRTSRFCGHCGSPTASIDAGRRKQCTSESCKKKIYPRVVIMLVIDKENDRALLSDQSRLAPRLWTCLAGFIEPGESLEEAVRRETLEETGIEVGEVVYHSSQPWPVGPGSMPCQLMMGFFAYAKTFDIHVDKSELQDAQWYKREDVKKALTYNEYERTYKTTANKVNQICKGLERGQVSAVELITGSGDLVPMFVPGPYAIAHHLISSWVHEDTHSSNGLQSKQLSSLSNL